MVELDLLRRLAVLLGEVPAEELVLLLQAGVVHGADGCDARVAVVEGRAAHEGRDHLVTLGAMQVDVLQPVARPRRRRRVVPAEARVAEAQRLPAAVARNAPWAPLRLGAPRVVHGAGALLATLDKRRGVQREHRVARQGQGELHPGLGVLASDNPHLRGLHARAWAVLLKEAVHVGGELHVRERRAGSRSRASRCSPRTSRRGGLAARCRPAPAA